jgi:hypothetical protein
MSCILSLTLFSPVKASATHFSKISKPAQTTPVLLSCRNSFQAWRKAATKLAVSRDWVFFLAMFVPPLPQHLKLHRSLLVVNLIDIFPKFFNVFLIIQPFR